jgi:glycosyltransferase involved in cell wall biosynthesis
MTPLRVGLNLFFLSAHAGGAGRYARELVGRMLDLEPGIEITTFVSRDAPRDFLASLEWARDVRWVRLPSGIGGPPGHVLVEMAAQMGTVAARGARARLDVVHGLANVAPVAGGRFARVVTLLDITWIHQPETLDRRTRIGMRASSLASARAADRVIAISQTSRRDFVETLGLDPGRVDTVPLGVAAPDGSAARRAPSRAELGLPDGPLVLTIAQLRPHKNLGALVQALPELDAQLVVAGSGEDPAERDRLRAAASSAGVADRLHLLGAVPDDRLEALYATADCFALPSLHEGFGLPVLEAMARGLPVACSDRSALAEVAGDAALRFDPTAPAEIAAALRGLLTDAELRASLVERGRERARGFTWEETARGTLRTYRRALEGRARG